MKRNYTHLSSEERAMIQIEQGNGSSLRAIALCLGRNVSSVSRELARNRHEATAYSATSAALAYRTRRVRSVRRRKLVEGGWLHQRVHDGLVFWCWSPQQIASRLRHMYPDDPTRQVSHETIYSAIYAHPRGSLKKDMIQSLRQAKPRRGSRRTTAARKSFVPEDLRIVHRPEEIAERKLPGHWEGDFIKGAYNRSAVGTLVERKTRFVVLCRMDGCTAQDALEEFTRQMKKPCPGRSLLIPLCGSTSIAAGGVGTRPVAGVRWGARGPRGAVRKGGGAKRVVGAYLGVGMVAGWGAISRMTSFAVVERCGAVRLRQGYGR